MLDEGQHVFGGKCFVHNDLAVGVEQYHRRGAVHVVGLLIVDVDVGSADVDERQFVFAHIAFPFVHIALVANGIDFKHFVVRFGQRVVEGYEFGGLLLAVVAVGVPEPQHHVLLRQRVARNPVLGVLGLIGVGHYKFLTHSADERLLEEVDRLSLVVDLCLGGPGAFAFQVVVLDKVDEDLVPADVFGAVFVFRQREVHKIAQHSAVVGHAVEQELGVFCYRVGILIVEQAKEIDVRLVEQHRRVYQAVVLQVDIVPIVGAVVAGLPFVQVGVGAACGDGFGNIDVAEHRNQLREAVLCILFQVFVLEFFHLVRERFLGSLVVSDGF